MKHDCPNNQVYPVEECNICKIESRIEELEEKLRVAKTILDEIAKPCPIIEEANHEEWESMSDFFLKSTKRRRDLAREALAKIRG